MKRIFFLLLIIFLPMYIFLKGVEINAFNKKIYIDSYKKNNVVDITGKELKELEIITEDIFSYLRDDSDEEILSSYFNSREIRHMEDVKVLFERGFKIKKLSLALFLFGIIGLVVLGESSKIAKGIFYGNLVWWFIIIILFMFTTMNFNKYFTYFHEIFFDNDLWLLNPYEDLLIQMLPEEFFINIFKRILLFFISILAIIQLISYIFMKKGKNTDGFFNQIKGLFQ